MHHVTSNKMSSYIYQQRATDFPKKTKSNREIWSLGMSIRNLILSIAKNRDEHDSAVDVNKIKFPAFHYGGC
jgi:hypothetical protein